jgi:glycosyltransferase involved in cell wall biosynthesis
MKKKIIHITKGEIGGLDTIVKKIVGRSREIYNPRVFFFSKGGERIYSEFDNERIAGLRLGMENIFGLFFNKIRYFNEADLIHIHHPKLWILFSPLCFFRKKNVFTFHVNFGSNIKKNIFIKTLIYLVISYATLFSKKLIFLTNAQKENLKKYSFFKNKFEKDSEIIGNFINKGDVLTRKKSVTKKVLFVGRYTKLKGFGDLEVVMRELTNVQFNLIGESDLDLDLPNVINHGVKNHFEIFKEYDRNDILILPSYTETWGIVILEAMARGLAVLASDLPTIREYFKNRRNGYLFEPGNINEMKKKILFLLDNPKEIKRISKNNLRDIKKFTEEKQIKKYGRVYEEIIKLNDKKC